MTIPVSRDCHCCRIGASLSAHAEEMVTLAAAALGKHGTVRLKDFDRFPAPLYATDETGTHRLFQPRLRRLCRAANRRSASTNGVSAGNSVRTTALPFPRTNARWRSRCKPLVRCAGSRRSPSDPMAAPSGSAPFPLRRSTRKVAWSGQSTCWFRPMARLCRDLIATAQKCRRLAGWVDDSAASTTLTNMAVECEGQAASVAHELSAGSVRNRGPDLPVVRTNPLRRARHVWSRRRP